VLVVAPYVYARCSGHQAVFNLLKRLEAGEIDAIASQVHLKSSAFLHRTPGNSYQSSCQHVVAAVGPVVADTLRKRGIEARVMPRIHSSSNR